ncbi:phosphate/phosphite/phosphonate ABC transporter substrate-binding protein [Leptolyngbya sp. AN03gr2]|uniref:phosphate/phosphite/phosphonate ABC transporter substrate-binding protein n=1 Tax=unclassified Leptolyngbya TaxID=2650499 RepID=UPI003D322D5F
MNAFRTCPAGNLVEITSLRNSPLRPFIRVLAVAIALSLISCHKTPPTQTTPPTTPVSLRFSVQPTQNRAEQERMVAPLEDHLEKVLGQPIEFLIAKDYKEGVDMLVDGRANAAYIGTTSYFEALERGAKVKPLVAPIERHTTRPWYRACIVVPANSPIKTLTDLKGKRVAFVSRSSTSGYLMPLAALRKLGIEPEQDFAATLFGGTHEQTQTLLSTQADAIATNLASYTHWKKQNKSAARNSRVIWQSEPFPHSPVLVSETLPPELIDQLKAAFLTTPEGIQDIMGAETSGYTLVEPEDYEAVQNLRQHLNLSAEP